MCIRDRATDGGEAVTIGISAFHQFAAKGNDFQGIGKIQSTGRDGCRKSADGETADEIGKHFFLYQTISHDNTRNQDAELDSTGTFQGISCIQCHDIFAQRLAGFIEPCLTWKCLGQAVDVYKRQPLPCQDRLYICHYGI